MGKPWTEEQKAAARARGKAQWAARQAAQNEQKTAHVEQLDIEKEIAKDVENTVSTPVTPAEETKVQEEPQTTISTELSQQELLTRAIEAIAKLAEVRGEATGPQVKNGQLTGTIDRFSVKKSDYEDFTPRLMEDQTLVRFGFKENYYLDYNWEVVRYETIDHVWMQEPKITIDLNRKEFDETTGELTGRIFKMYRIIIHEDPNTAVWVARNNGITVPDDPEGEQAFLNEMRFLQVRDWLRECFMPKKPTSHSSRREMVVNGRVVEYFEVNSEESQSLPFTSLNSKL